MELDQELETYRKHLPELLADEGKHVLIKGDVIEGIYESRDEALRRGLKVFGIVPFMVKEIEEKETVYFISRFSI